MDPGAPFRSALFRHDRKIVESSLRSALSRRGDRLFLGAFGLVALAALHVALSGRSSSVAAAIVMSVSALAGLGAARLIRRRLVFHASDGALAALALCRRGCRAYGLALHVTAAPLLIVLAAIARPEAAPLAPLGYLVGAVAGHGLGPALSGVRSFSRGLMPRSLRAVLGRPLSGLFVGALLVLALPGLATFDPPRAAAFAGIVGTVVALALTTVDPSAVRFLTLSGYSATRIIGLQARPLLLCLVVSLPAALFLSGHLAAFALAGVGTAALTLMTARILAYRVHDRRIADALLGICVLICILTGVTFPPALPPIILAVLWVLAYRSARATWSLI